MWTPSQVKTQDFASVLQPQKPLCALCPNAVTSVLPHVHRYPVEPP